MDAIKKWYGRPGKEDKRLIREFSKFLDERRVFSAPFNVEVVEACLASIRHVSEFGSEVQSKVEHEFSRQALNLIVDACRRLMDKWWGFRTPTFEGGGPPPVEQMGHLVEFFKDLGQLRGEVREALLMLREFSEPKLRAPSILDG